MQLYQALSLSPGAVVALTGGGGKTSALYRLGREFAAAGRAVMLSGTARFTPPPRGHGNAAGVVFVDAADPDALVHAAQPPWPRLIATGRGQRGRLLPVTEVQVARVHAVRPDVAVVLEADGSAMRPFKAPASHEPAVPPCATVVVPVAGIDALGMPLDGDHVHRPERVAALTGVAPGSSAVVTADMMAAVLCHPEGGWRRTPPGARWIPVINKVDTEERRRAFFLLAPLLGRRAARVVATRLLDPDAEPVVALWEPRTAGERYRPPIAAR